MSLRINHNLAAENAHRSFLKKDFRGGKNIQSLSQGLKASKSGDGPATMFISERMRSQVVGLSQAVQNSETAMSLVQTAEASLNNVGHHLRGIRRLAIHAMQIGEGSQMMLEADQAELIATLDHIDRIAKNAHFGEKALLDGSNGISGQATGEELDFVSAEDRTLASPPGGYSVKITRTATQAQTKSDVALSRYLLNGGETISLREQGNYLQVMSQMGESAAEFLRRLKKSLRKKGLLLEVELDEEEKLIIRHQNYGSDEGFSISSSTVGVFSKEADQEEWVQNGLDVSGTIGEEYATGKGQHLTGGKGTSVEGLTLHYSGIVELEINETPLPDAKLFELQAGKPIFTTPKGVEVGRVEVTTRALTFQTGGTQERSIRILLPNTESSNLGQWVENESGFQSLRDLDIRSEGGAMDALRLTEHAIEEVAEIRSKLGSIQHHTLESNIASLGIAKENLINAESLIHDSNMAVQMADYTKNEIVNRSALALLAQANQSPSHVLTLLK